MVGRAGVSTPRYTGRGLALVAVARLRWTGPGEVRAVRVTLAGTLRVMFKAIEGWRLRCPPDGTVPPSWLTTF
jgi:hypothetical protein